MFPLLLQEKQDSPIEMKVKRFFLRHSFCPQTPALPLETAREKEWYGQIGKRSPEEKRKNVPRMGASDRTEREKSFVVYFFFFFWRSFFFFFLPRVATVTGKEK